MYQILCHFVYNFHTRHRISPERNVAWTNKNAGVNLQCVPYKVTYFSIPLTPKWQRSVCLLWLNIRRPLRCHHQSCDMSSYLSITTQTRTSTTACRRAGTTVARGTWCVYSGLYAVS